MFVRVLSSSFMFLFFLSDVERGELRGWLENSKFHRFGGLALFSLLLSVLSSSPWLAARAATYISIQRRIFLNDKINIKEYTAYTGLKRECFLPRCLLLFCQLSSYNQ